MLFVYINNMYYLNNTYVRVCVWCVSQLLGARAPASLKSTPMSTVYP